MPLPDKSYITANKAPRVFETQFFQPEIQGANWDKSFPYKLLLLEVSKDEEGKIKYKKLQGGYEFILPIPPQELNLSLPFATTVNANLTGITEKHGGAPFRDIVLSGTTGITPIKNNASGKDFDPALNTLTTIFSGTTDAVNNTINAANSFISGEGLIRQRNNVNAGTGTSLIDDNTIHIQSTGYYQIRLLERFLESYAELKKRSNQGINTVIGIDPKDLRLAFSIYKEDATYICTGVSFNKKRSAQSPMEYVYSLQLKAWARINLTDVSPLSDSHITKRSSDFYSKLLSKVVAANAILDGARDTLQALIRDPVNRFFEIAREVTTFLKNGTNTVWSVVDFPDTIQREISKVAVSQWDSLVRRNPLLPPVRPVLLAEGLGKFKGSSTTQSSQALTSDPTKPSISNNSPSNQTRSEVNKILGQITPNMLNLPSALIGLMDRERKRINSLTRKDFEDRRKEIQKLADDYADLVGAGSSSYNEIYNRPNVSSTKEPSDEDYEILFTLNELSNVLDQLSATTEIEEKPVTSLEYVAGLAQASGIAFTVPTSKFSIPFPYGVDLPQLALQYLGDPDRWHEIATLNGLRAPYVDEVGFKLPFLTNGDGQTLYVSTSQDLFINQTVWISSNTQKRSKRLITGIKEIYPEYIAITVDGDSDLDLFTTPAQAVLEAFLPGTVNSQQLLYIPSNKAAPEELVTKQIPGVNDLDPLLQTSGVDLLLTPGGDFIVTSDGDTKLAYGLANIVQTVKLALSTPKGRLLRHPGYGLDVQVGDSTADASAEDIANSAKEMFEDDPAFSGVKSVSVEKNGPSCKVTILLGLAGISNLVPISFTINR